MAIGFTAVAAGPVAATGLAAGALFVFGVAVASAAVFFVGIVAFRSIGAAAFAVAVLLEVFVALIAGRVAGFAATGFAWALADAGLTAPFGAGAAFVLVAGTLRVTGFAAAGFAVAGLATFGGAARVPAADRALLAAGLFAVVRARAAAVGVLARAVVRLALARFTEAAGCAVVRAAALDAVAGLALREGFAVALAPLRAFVAADVGIDRFDADALPAVVFADRVAVGLVAADLAALIEAVFGDAGLAEAVLLEAVRVVAGLAAAAFALRSRPAGCVLGDMSATPEIGQSPRA